MCRAAVSSVWVYRGDTVETSRDQDEDAAIGCKLIMITVPCWCKLWSPPSDLTSHETRLRESNRSATQTMSTPRIKQVGNPNHVSRSLPSSARVVTRC